MGSASKCSSLCVLSYCFISLLMPLACHVDATLLFEITVLDLKLQLAQTKVIQFTSNPCVCHFLHNCKASLTALG